MAWTRRKREAGAPADDAAAPGSSMDRQAWEGRWVQAVREHGDRLATMPPNAYLTETAADLPPGRALDAGCGHGAEALWLAAQGWRVTAVDFSATALAQARSTAASLPAEAAERVEWVEGDLGVWVPAPAAYDLVVCLYVHADSVDGLVRRLADGVAPGGTLLLVGHRPVDPETGKPTPAAGQNQVSIGDAVYALGTRSWDLAVAENRVRAQPGTGVDAVVVARRRA